METFAAAYTPEKNIGTEKKEQNKPVRTRAENQEIQEERIIRYKEAQKAAEGESQKALDSHNWEAEIESALNTPILNKEQTLEEATDIQVAGFKNILKYFFKKKEKIPPISTEMLKYITNYKAKIQDAYDHLQKIPKPDSKRVGTKFSENPVYNKQLKKLYDNTISDIDELLKHKKLKDNPQYREVVKMTEGFLRNMGKRQGKPEYLKEIEGKIKSLQEILK